MTPHVLVSLALVAGLAGTPLVVAQEEVDCMECHEPAEDWEGMTVDEIIVQAKDPGNKRHRDNDALTDEQLRAIVAPLME